MKDKLFIVCFFTFSVFLFSCGAKKLPDDVARERFSQNYQPNYLDIENINASAHTDIIVKDFFVQSGFIQQNKFFSYKAIADSVLTDLNRIFKSNMSLEEKRDLDVVITVHSLSFKSLSGLRIRWKGAADIEVRLYNHTNNRQIKSERRAFEKVVRSGDDYKRVYNHLSHPSNIMYQMLNKVMDEIKISLSEDRDAILHHLSVD